MKRRHIALALAFVSCAVSLVFSKRYSGDELVEAAPRRHLAATEGGASEAFAPLVSIAALRSRKELFSSPSGGHRDLFSGQAVAPPLPYVAPPQAEVPPLPPIPVMPFTYIGKKAADGAWEVYLARGDETLIVHEKTVMDSTYRVESINPPTLSLVYLPQNVVQTLDIGSAN
ncbi:hypothetical protein [Trinickia fusca]|uniref:Secretion system X translation initiation factor n=1 Tax=Trinickia fusca TaxID=2419777 RepID=A0A494X799_9BURK|nr:hypothetical protein [Trinickia fusca]RKP46468.1 hypothetical protein D7S89_17760 [Trinickia fusca]